jgi:glucosamine--fructose-6-phosphate aminotransferase (isomerizing)
MSRSATRSAPAPTPLERLAPNGPDAMGREIAAGPAGVEAALGAVRESPAVGLLADAARVILVGTGASLAVAEVAAPLAGERWSAREASAVALGDLDGRRAAPGDVAVVVSMSGRSPESRAAARRLAQSGCPIVALTADERSPLAAAADVVVATPIGEETGAATKSALSALSALLALAGELETDAESAARLRDRLRATVADVSAVAPGGALVAKGAEVWAVGFGPALGLARATSLLLHEKARRPTVFCSPSEFRHGPIEAATRSDALILLDPGQIGGEVDGSLVAYLDRLAAEAAELGVGLIRIGPRSTPPIAVDGSLPLAVHVPIDESAPRAERVLHALVRAQQLARATAHARGTYADEFVVLRRIVRAADDLVPPT